MERTSDDLEPSFFKMQGQPGTKNNGSKKNNLPLGLTFDHFSPLFRLHPTRMPLFVRAFFLYRLMIGGQTDVPDGALIYPPNHRHDLLHQRMARSGSSLAELPAMCREVKGILQQIGTGHSPGGRLSHRSKSRV